MTILDPSSVYIMFAGTGGSTPSWYMGEVPPNIARRNLPSSHPVCEKGAGCERCEAPRVESTEGRRPEGASEASYPFSSGGSGGDWVPPREGGRTKIVEKEKVLARRRREGPRKGPTDDD